MSGERRECIRGSSKIPDFRQKIEVRRLSWWGDGVRKMNNRGRAKRGKTKNR